jgi:choline dehydrogenase-like flavoprotein
METAAGSHPAKVGRRAALKATAVAWNCRLQIADCRFNFRFNLQFNLQSEISNLQSQKRKKVTSYAANRFTRNWVVDERQHPTTGTPYAWVRANVLGGKTNFWGRGALRYGPLQFKAASLDGFEVDWPI